MRPRIRRSFVPSAGLCSVLALILVLSGCGGEKAGGQEAPPEEAIASASRAMAKAGSARISGSMTMEIETQEGETVEAEISSVGVVDYRAGRAHVVLDMSDLAGPSVEMEQIYDSPVFYSKLPSPNLPPGRWVKIDLEALAAAASMPVAFPAFRHPAPVLDYLKAVEDIEEVGEEEVGGIDTTHYRGTVGQSAEHSTGAEIPVEFWIDREGLVRRMRFDFAYTLLGTGNEASASQTVDFSEFGVTVDVEPPPSSQIVPLETLLEKAESQP